MGYRARGEWVVVGRGSHTTRHESADHPGITLTFIDAHRGQSGDYWTVTHLEGRVRNAATLEEAEAIADQFRDEHVHHYRPKGPATGRVMTCVCGVTA